LGAEVAIGRSPPTPDFKAVNKGFHKGLREYRQAGGCIYPGRFSTSRCSREDRNPGNECRETIQQGSPARSHGHGKRIDIGRPEIDLRSAHPQQLNHIRIMEARGEMNRGEAPFATRVDVCSPIEQLPAWLRPVPCSGQVECG
jgi:hypothetical protein